MGTILASALISSAKLVQDDLSATRWTDAEWLGWLNDGQVEIAVVARGAFTKTANSPTVAGAKQAAPADCAFIIRPVCDMGADGNTPGAAVRWVSQTLLDSQMPTWRAATPAAAPKNILYDPTDRRTYFTYPPLSGPGNLMLTYVAVPARVAAVVNTITLDDMYAPTLMDYMLYRACSKDTDIAGLSERAKGHYGAFKDSLAMIANLIAPSAAAKGNDA